MKEPILDRDAIMKILPHRPPFVLIDAVLEGDADRVVTIKQVRNDEFFFEGHFPGNPVMPGVMIVEAMAQTCLILYHYNFEIEDLFFLTTEKSRFWHPVYPGDHLRLVAQKVKILKTMGLAKVEAFVNDRRVAKSEFGFASGRSS